ncbi:AraC family transcriptional regulator [Paenibacillus aestuarii]|uniref:Helix-turn-helix domain-containing protein n=1 Tax=Paenibacillus aestuarii TaxID=516965 RepID=A0ABW0KF54_9BACL|nr:AraC family transcriptional regulator [Paenibacillus aestuarii]
MSTFQASQYFEDLSFPFHIEQYTIRKGQEIPLHTHDFVELVYVVEGCAVHEMSGMTYELRSGDIFILEPNIYHSYKGAMNKETIVYNVLFKLELLHKELNALCEIPSFLDFFYIAPFLRKNATFYPHLTLSGLHQTLFENHLETLYREEKERQTGYHLVIKTRFIECMVQLSRFYAAHRNPHPTPAYTDEQWIASVVSLIEQHYNKPFSLDQLSRLCGMSIPSFTAKFKAYTKKTFVEYKHDIQIKEACKMMETTSEKIADIAYEVGFEDLSFFYRVFRKKMGIPPLKYRLSKKEY